jgi:hypothetical protein
VDVDDTTSEQLCETDEQQLGKYYLTSCYLISYMFSDRLRGGWRSSIYGFFRKKVDIKYDHGRKFHFFRCSADRCKGSGGVRRYLDSKDRAATSNLKTHANRCFGVDVVNAATNNTKAGPRDGSIFAAFARAGQRPATVSHRGLSSEEIR